MSDQSLTKLKTQLLKSFTSKQKPTLTETTQEHATQITTQLSSFMIKTIHRLEAMDTLDGQEWAS